MVYPSAGRAYLGAVAGKACAGVAVAGKAYSGVADAGKACAGVAIAGKACSGVADAGKACAGVADAAIVGKACAKMLGTGDSRICQDNHVQRKLCTCRRAPHRRGCPVSRHALCIMALKLLQHLCNMHLI